MSGPERPAYRILEDVLAALGGSAGGTTLGQLAQPGDVLTVELSTPTAQMGDGDVLADFQEVADFARAAGRPVEIRSITVLDKDDQGAAFDILTCPNAVSLGTENDPPSIADADAIVQRVCRIETYDYIDLGGCRIATKANLGIVVKPASGSRSMRIGAISRGTATYATSGLVLRIGLAWF